MPKIKDLLLEFKKIGLNEETNVDIKPLSKDVYALILKNNLLENEENKDVELEESIIKLINEKSFSERVEGKFEKLLTSDAQKKLKQMIESKKIEIYKKPDYNQGIYVLKKNTNNGSNTCNGNSSTNNIYSKEEEKNIEKLIRDQNYLIINNEFQAKALSQKYCEQIKSGEFKGIKDFDGNYYLIKSEMLQSLKEKIYKSLSVNKTLIELESALNLDKKLIKLGIAFLKDDGEVIEKRKEVYEAI